MYKPCSKIKYDQIIINWTIKKNYLLNLFERNFFSLLKQYDIQSTISYTYKKKYSYHVWPSRRNISDLDPSFNNAIYCSLVNIDWNVSEIETYNCCIKNRKVKWKNMHARELGKVLRLCCGVRDESIVELLHCDLWLMIIVHNIKHKSRVLC